MYYVYKMIHVPTGRVYVGQRKLPKGKTPETDGYMGSGKVWKQIYKQHPEECVKVVLEVVERKDETDTLERWYISHYRSLMGNKCVNIADGGQGGFTGTPWNKGKMFSEESRKKMSEAKKGRRVSEEHKRKLSESASGKKNHFFGKQHSEETKRKLSEALSGEKHPFFGKQHSEETKRKISETLKNRTKIK